MCVTLGSNVNEGDELLNESIYAPPEAEVGDSISEEQPYYVVGTKKFFWLTLLTIGVYLVYWFYRNWNQIKIRNNEDLWPVPRGIFYIFFIWPLFTDVRETLKTKSIQHDWQPALITWLMVLLLVAATVLAQLAERNIGMPFTDIANVLIFPLYALVMLPAQRAINVASEDPEGKTNSRFTVANWLWMAFGLLYWLIMLLGLYFIITEPELFIE